MMRYGCNIRTFCITILLLSTSIPGTVFGYNFVPTDLEWKAWKPYCKARYARSFPNYKFSKTVSKSKWKRWDKHLGPVFNHIHHYCAGVSYLTKAPYSSNPARYYKSAAGEMKYTYDKANKDTPIYSEMSAKYGLALFGARRLGQAITVLEGGIKRQPKVPASYLALATIYTKTKKYDDAIKALETGLEKISGKKSAKLVYRLGNVYFELGDYEKARMHAKKAAKLGYRLSRLKKKLKKIDQWE